MIFQALRPMPAENPFAVILAGREALKSRKEQLDKWIKDERAGLPFQPPSEKTLADYRRDVARLMKHDNPWEAAAKTKKKLTWLKRKSALLTIAKVEITELLKAQDQMQRSGELKGSPENTAKWNAMIEQIHYYTSIIEARPPEPDVNKPENHPLPVKTPRKSKRSTGKLPADWREWLVNRMPKWYSQALVCAVTGCRPSEIEAGIGLMVGNGEMRVVIHGKKTGPYSGQNKRGLIWSLKNASPLVRDLADLVKEAGGQLTIDYAGHTSKSPAKTFSSAMTQAGKRCFPDSKIKLTPYSMRHAVASDLKASDLTPQEISKALGHQSLETQSTYGHRSLGTKGGTAPESVKGTNNVRGTVSEVPYELDKKAKAAKAVKTARKAKPVKS